MLTRALGSIPALLLLSGCYGDPLAERKAGVFAEHTSPTGLYTVSLSGRPGPVPGGVLGRGVHIIRAAVRRGSVEFVPPRQIHYADSMDDSFDEDYCGATWVLENVLRLDSCHPVAGAPHRTSDTVTIRNAGSQAITFLTVSTNTDMLLLFQVGAGQGIRVAVTGRTDQQWLHVTGLWADGQDIPTASGNFLELPSGGTAFEIAVGAERVKVLKGEGPSNGPLQPTSGV
jgi:hypothetical protein